VPLDGGVIGAGTAAVAAYRAVIVTAAEGRRSDLWRECARVGLVVVAQRPQDRGRGWVVPALGDDTLGGDLAQAEAPGA
jgi:hypothetical protein